MSLERAKRYITQEQAQLEIYGHVGSLKARVRNLSRTGAFLEVVKGPYLPQKGDLLNLTVKLESLQREHQVSAEVIWCRDGDVGVCFINKDEVLERMMAKVASF